MFSALSALQQRHRGEAQVRDESRGTYVAPGQIGDGTDAGDTVTLFIDPNEAHFFPLGPTQSVQDVLCLGRLYRDGQVGSAALCQGNPVRHSLCLRPRALIKGLHH
jgi:hypothetical protein